MLLAALRLQKILTGLDTFAGFTSSMTAVALVVLTCLRIQAFFDRFLFSHNRLVRLLSSANHS